MLFTSMLKPRMYHKFPSRKTLWRDLFNPGNNTEDSKRRRRPDFLNMQWLCLSVECTCSRIIQSHVCRVPLETVFNNETSHWRSPTKETLSNAWSLAWSPNRPIITSRCDSAQSDRECSALYGPRAPLEVKCQLFRLRRCTQPAKKSPNTVWQGIMATLA